MTARGSLDSVLSAESVARDEAIHQPIKWIFRYKALRIRVGAGGKVLTIARSGKNYGRKEK